MATDTERTYIDSVIAQSKRRLARILDLEDVLSRIVGPPALNLQDPANGDVRREAQALLNTVPDESERPNG